MDNQNVLNGVSLQEASKIISKELIQKKLILLKMRDEFYNRRKQFESDYVAANDGDSSENAPLQSAMENLRSVTGDIASNEAVILGLEGIEDLDYLVGTFEFRDILEAYRMLHVVDKDNINAIYQINSGDGLVEVLNRLSIEELTAKLNEHFEYNQQNNSPTESNILLNKIKEFYTIRKKPPYNYCGLIVPYTTVRLKLHRKDQDDEIMTYKILPAGLSFLDIGVIAANSRVAQAILGKQKGDTVSIQHSSGKVILRYEILDIY